MLTTEALRRTVREALETMSDHQRLEFWNKVEEGYCRACGREDEDQRCQCWNDA